MREFFLVPVNELEKFLPAKISQSSLHDTGNHPTVMTDNLINNNELSPDTVVNLYEKINSLRKEYDNMKREKEKRENEVVAEQKNIADNTLIQNRNRIKLVLESAISVVPKDSLDTARELVEKLIKDHIVTLENPDKIVLINDNLSVSLRDFLRALFIRQAKVSKIQKFLSKILPYINAKYIRNRKVFFIT